VQALAVPTSRLEAFSDGVIAIAITLLVLEIHVPETGGPDSLGHQLADQWPSYAAYVVSFVTIGIIWVNHHAMVSRIRKTNHTVLILNLFLLMSIAILPFTTDLVAEYLRESDGEHLAAAIYSGSLLLMGLAFYAMQWYTLNGEGGELLGVELSEVDRRAIKQRNALGLVPYAVATAVAPLSAYLTLAICAAVAAFYASPVTRAGSD
jgi:uncharacterized membrane protein